METVGDERKHSGPLTLKNANANIISCCSSFYQDMCRFGYVPLAAPVMNFANLDDIFLENGLQAQIPAMCYTHPYSFNLFVTLRENESLNDVHDIRNNFLKIQKNGRDQTS